VTTVEEPMILATVVCPKEYMGAVIKLFNVWTAHFYLRYASPDVIL
jgi:translation elongation factor EF-4